MKFYLGTDDASWLRQLAVPLFISRRRLAKYKTLPRARVPWALDSGAFTELKLHGCWSVTPEEYVEDVYRFQEGVGKLEWAAIQDWMCEPFMVAKTGLSVEEHQHRTVQSYLDLTSLAPSLPFVPVLQGWTRADYEHHIQLYLEAGVDLAALPIVGLGSVCRRQTTTDTIALVRFLSALGLRLHGFGIKTTGLEVFGNLLRSSDSMAWCYSGWHEMRRGLLPRQKHNCAHCRWYALMWGDKCLKKVGKSESRSSSSDDRQGTFDFECPRTSESCATNADGF